MKVLIACEFSGIIREEFKKLGHDAWSCDLLDTEIPGQHIVGDVLKILDQGWDLMVAHPPCTYITNAGVRHLHIHVKSKNGKQTAIFGPKRWEAMKESCEFFNVFKNAPIPKICIENPIPHKYARELIGKYTQIIQPWQFGHTEKKATCLWLKGLPNLVPTKIMPPPYYAKCHLESPGPDRWKNRSRSYQGIGNAMAAQWGKL